MSHLLPFVPAILQLAAALALVLLPVAVSALVIYLRRSRSARAADLLTYLTGVAARCVAASADVVREAKDRGTWAELRPVLAANVVARILRIGGESARELLRITRSGESPEAMAHQLMEAEVERLRAAKLLAADAPAPAQAPADPRAEGPQSPSAPVGPLRGRTVPMGLPVAPAPHGSRAG